MDKKLIGIICAIIAMVTGVVYFIWGMVFNGWDTAWIVFIPCGVAIAIVSMIGNYMREKKEGDKE